MRRTVLGLTAALALIAPAAAQVPDWRQAPPLRTEPTTSETLELAARAVALDPSTQQLSALSERALVAAAALMGKTVDPAFVDATRQALKEDPSLPDRLRARAAEVYARSYSDEELTALIGYEESPLGRSIMVKRSTVGPFNAPMLTPEEQAFETAFLATPVGARLKNKRLQVGLIGGMASAEYGIEIGQRAKAIYCGQRTDCSPFRPSSEPSASAPSTVRR